MKLPDWRSVVLGEGILRESVPDNRGIVLWLPAASAEGGRHWERVASVPGAAQEAESLCATAAQSFAATVRGRGLLGRLFGGLRGSSGARTWLLPNGEAAEQQGERQTDLLLAWAADGAPPLDEDRLRSRWPQARGVRRLGPNLFLVAGVEPPAAAGAVGPGPTAALPREQAEELLAAARQAGDRRREALALTDLGVVAVRGGEPARAVSLLEEALRIAGPLGDPALTVEVSGNLGRALLDVGQPHRALELLEQARAGARAGGDAVAEKVALDRLGDAFAALGDADRALALYAQARDLARAVGDWHHEADVNWQIAIQHAALGRADQAAAAGQAAIDLLRARNHPDAAWLADALARYRAGAAGLAVPPAPAAFAGGAGPVAGAPAAGPGLLRMAFSAVKALATAVGSGLATVPAEAHRRRLQTCQGCEHHTGVRCRVCGCFTKVKAWMPHEHCPLGKWPV